MLNRWKRAIVGRPPQSRPMRPRPTVPNLADIPPLPVGDPGGLSAVDPSVLSDYLGRRVLEVRTTQAGDRAADEFGLPRQSARSGAAGWRIHFEDGVVADVRLQRLGAAGSEFPGLQAGFHAQQRDLGQPSNADNISLGATGSVSGTPYETYHRGALLVACGSLHEAVVVASSPDPPRLHETMAGIAVLALRLIDD